MLLGDNAVPGSATKSSRASNAGKMCVHCHWSKSRDTGRHDDSIPSHQSIRPGNQQLNAILIFLKLLKLYNLIFCPCRSLARMWTCESLCQSAGSTNSARKRPTFPFPSWQLETSTLAPGWALSSQHTGELER